MNTIDLCTWAVCYDIDGKTQDDGKTKRTICAWFRNPVNAEDFIANCIPEETRSRFYIKHKNDIEKE